MAGTLWAAYNSVTESEDQYTAARHRPANHLGRVWFGEGYLHKARSYFTAVEMMRSGMN